MGRLDKDIHQKESAIRFCLVNSMVPFLEVNIQNYRELSDTATMITDVDVLGVQVGSIGEPRRVIFDCKTLGKTSPINRAFWASGLMAFSSCSEAFVILRKRASEAHRLSAKQINVHLFDEKQFSNYAESCSINFSIDYCYSTNIQNWISLENCVNGNSQLEQFNSFINSESPLETDCVKGLRRFLAALNKIKGELDPSKPKHQSLFFSALSVFIYLMSQIVHDLRNIIDFDSDEKTFEKLLKYYIWGGKDSFILREKMTKLFSSQNENFSTLEPELKNWSEFIELSRKLLDSPSDIQECILPIREMGFRCVVDTVKEKDQYCSNLIGSNKRIRQFSVLMTKYLVSAVKLPNDFEEVVTDSFNALR